MGSLNDNCFVCKTLITKDTSTMNLVVNMPVCINCKDSQREKEVEQELLDSLADGFVCGCI